MLLAVPRGFFARRYEFVDGPRPVARLDLATLRERGELRVGRDRYEVGREGIMRGRFYLRRRGTTVATAVKRSALHRSFEVSVDETTYELRAASAFLRTFLLSKGPRQVGRVRPAGAFTRKVRIELPSELPLEVRLFMTWLVLILWKREESND